MPQDVSKKPGQNAASTARILPAKPDSAAQPQDPDPPRLRTDGECVATAPWRFTFNSSASPLGQHIARSRLPIRADHGHHVCSGDRRGWLGTPSCHRPARPGPFQPFLTFSACCLLISPPRPCLGPRTGRARARLCAGREPAPPPPSPRGIRSASWACDLELVVHLGNLPAIISSAPSCASPGCSCACGRWRQLLWLSRSHWIPARGASLHCTPLARSLAVPACPRSPAKALLMREHAFTSNTSTGF